MKKCPLCSEEIQSEAIKCRFCYERLDTKLTFDASDDQLKNQAKLHVEDYCLPREESEVESPPLLSLHQSTVVIPRQEKNQKPKKSFSWKSLIAAFIIAAFLVAFVSATLGVNVQKNISWTVWWIYLTIEAWRYWKWKALLPYPVFLLAYITAGLIMVSAGVNYASWTNLIAQITLNIGGLIWFYLLFRKSKKAHELNCPSASIGELETTGLLKGLAVVVLLACTISLDVALTGKMDDSDPWGEKNPFLFELGKSINPSTGIFNKVPKSEAPGLEAAPREQSIFSKLGLVWPDSTKMPEEPPLSPEAAAPDNEGVIFIYRHEHFARIRRAHPDFEKYRDNGTLKAWIQKQPLHWRDSLLKAYNGGDSDPMISLLSQFKKANNIPIIEAQVSAPTHRGNNSGDSVSYTPKDKIRTPLTKSEREDNYQQKQILKARKGTVKISPADVSVAGSPEKQSQSPMENFKPSVAADQRYKGIKGIILMNGNVIEGQIISLDPDKVKIRTKEGNILSYDFKKEVERFITE